MADVETLTIEIEKRGAGTVLSITDSGKGMSTSVLYGLFEIGFVREQERIKTGLALPTSNAIVQRLGGLLIAESTEGQASRFVIELPPSAS